MQKSCAAAMGAYVWPHATCYALNYLETSDAGNPTYRKYLGLHLDEQRPNRVTLVLEARALTIDSTPRIAEIAHTVTGTRENVDVDSAFSVTLGKEQWETTKSAWIEVCKQIKRTYDKQREL